MAKEFSTRGFRFYIQIISHCSSHRFPKSRIFTIARCTLEMLPKSELTTRLSRRSLNRLNVILAGSRRIRRLNKKYRGKDYSTDVLSFSRIEGEKFPFPEVDVGDVILCPEVAVKNAKHDGISAKVEIATLVIHGLLHVFGYDHEKNDRDARKMFALQNRILRSLH
jgi:probable rRNA maturation factor